MPVVYRITNYFFEHNGITLWFPTYEEAIGSLQACLGLEELTTDVADQHIKHIIKEYTLDT